MPHSRPCLHPFEMFKTAVFNAMQGNPRDTVRCQAPTSLSTALTPGSSSRRFSTPRALHGPGFRCNGSTAELVSLYHFRAVRQDWRGWVHSGQPHNSCNAQTAAMRKQLYQSHWGTDHTRMTDPPYTLPAPSWLKAWAAGLWLPMEQLHHC